MHVYFGSTVVTLLDNTISERTILKMIVKYSSMIFKIKNITIILINIYSLNKKKKLEQIINVVSHQRKRIYVFIKIKNIVLYTELLKYINIILVKQIEYVMNHGSELVNFIYFIKFNNVIII